MNALSEDNKEKNSQYSDTIKWTIAAYAPTLAVDGLNPKFIGGVSKEDLSSEFIEEELEFLREEWGIIDKKTADHCMIYVYNGGANFDDYKTDIGILIDEINSDKIGEEEDDENDDEDDDDEDDDDDDEEEQEEDDEEDDDIKKIRDILKKSARLFVLQKYPEVGIIGSDLAKGIYLASRLYLVGIYSFEEAMSVSIKMSKKLQKSFKSWDEFMENVFWGLQCEFGVNPYNSDSFVTERRKYYYQQKEIKDGVYSLDWNTPLVDEWETHNALVYYDTMKWFNAAKALLNAINRVTPHSYCSTGVPRPSYKKQAAQSLVGSWGVHNGYDAEQTIKNLLQGKVHNEKLLKEVEQIKEISFNDYVKGKTLSEYIERMTLSEYIEYITNDNILDDEYTLNEYSLNNHKRHYNLIHTIIENYGDRGIIAWDLFRAIDLAADFYNSDYLTYEEALNASLIAAKKLQENFNSWDDYMNNYFLGYQYWSRDILENPLENPPLPEDGMLNFNESGTAFRKKLYQWLKNEEDSVYNIPWNTELKKEW